MNTIWDIENDNNWNLPWEDHYKNGSPRFKFYEREVNQKRQQFRIAWYANGNLKYKNVILIDKDGHDSFEKTWDRNGTFKYKHRRFNY